jgi:hypothetical protein
MRAQKQKAKTGYDILTSPNYTSLRETILGIVAGLLLFQQCKYGTEIRNNLV